MEVFANFHCGDFGAGGERSKVTGQRREEKSAELVFSAIAPAGCGAGPLPHRAEGGGPESKSTPVGSSVPGDAAAAERPEEEAWWLEKGLGHAREIEDAGMNEDAADSVAKAVAARGIWFRRHPGEADAGKWGLTPFTATRL